MTFTTSSLFTEQRLPYHHERIAQLRQKCDDMIASGEAIPFVYPFFFTAAHLVLLYMLIPHGKSPFLRSLRWPVWGVTVAFGIYIIRYARAHDAAFAYGTGFSAMWIIEWSAAFLLCYDAQTDFCRIERARGAIGDPQVKQSNGTTTLSGDKDKQKSVAPPTDGRSILQQKRVWQPYPVNSLIERVDWVLDLFTEFRGITWNWRNAIFPNPPKSIRDEIGYAGNVGAADLNPYRVPKIEMKAHPDKKELLRSAAFRFVFGYLTLDLLKTICLHDPYFTGFVDEPAPLWLPSLITNSFVLTRIYRMFIGMIAIKTILYTIFAMGPLFFVGLLGSDLIGVRGEPWGYPHEWGSFMSVFDKGLEGWWGVWWHQTFRFAFEAPGRRLVQYLKLEPKSLIAKAIQLVVAFTLSGTLHACGSFGALGESNPFHGPFTFFFLQPFGIGVNMLLRTGMKHLKFPQAVQWIVNFTWTHFWFYFTAPLLVDDFARSGTFLAEPYPISPLRALGFGTPGDSWWCWGGDWYRWHWDEKYWWKSGLMF